jgi:hypothetical protein
VAGLTARAGREFVLDAHGLTSLAAPTAVAVEWLEFIFEEFDGSRLWVPELVVVESTSGTPSDANVNRFLKTLDGPRHPGRFWLAHEREDLTRAGALRHDANAAGYGRISATDALVVAMSERLSMRRGVTILTSDPGDLEALVSQTARPNIAVAAVDRI